jgi:hypothetical protein
LAETGGIRRTALGALLDAAGRAGGVLAVMRPGGVLAVMDAVDEALGVDGPADAGRSGARPRAQPALATRTSSASTRHRNATIGSSCLVGRRADNSSVGRDM